MNLASWAGFDVEVRNIEILCQMRDADSVPWTLGIFVATAYLQPVTLKQILNPSSICWQAALLLKELTPQLASWLAVLSLAMVSQDFQARVVPSRDLASGELGLST